MSHAALVLVALLLVPVAAAEADTAAPTKMYLHMDAGSPAPVNTQAPWVFFPDPPSEDHSVCIEDPLGAQSFTSAQHHTWFAHSIHGDVDYFDATNDGYAAHAGDGLAYAALLDTSVAPIFTWHLADRPARMEMPPGVAPHVVVRATVYEGMEASPEGAAAGTIIAQGAAGPVTLAGPATEDTPNMRAELVDGTWAYTFQFPLTLAKDHVNQTGFSIMVEAFIDAPLCQSGHLMPAQFQPLHSYHGRFHHLEWSILNPLRLETFKPQHVGDDFVVHAVLNSPWGAYDVSGNGGNESAPTLRIVGPGVDTVLTPIHTSVDGHRVAGHDGPMRSAFLWDKAQETADGNFSLTLTASTDQGATRSWNTTIELCGSRTDCDTPIPEPPRCQAGGTTAAASCPGTPKEAPGFAAIAVLASVAVALLARRPRPPA